MSGGLSVCLSVWDKFTLALTTLKYKCYGSMALK
jgi:hypothetical protein